MKYILFILISTFFYSCGSEYYEVTKKDSSLLFYTANQIKKEIVLNDLHQIIQIKNFDDKKLSTNWVVDNVVLQDSIEYYGNGKIKTKGYGPSKPRYSNSSETGRKKNRRVEIIIDN